MNDEFFNKTPMWDLLQESLKDGDKEFYNNAILKQLNSPKKVNKKHLHYINKLKSNVTPPKKIQQIQNSLLSKLLKKQSTLTESAFPDNDQLIVMKGIMDGNTFGDLAKELDIKVGEVKTLLATGMKNANIDNIYELVVFGLRAGIIKDDPINIKDIENDFYKKGFYEGYPLWLFVMNRVVAGKTFAEIEREGEGGSKTSIEHARKQIVDKYNLGDSLAKYIRFCFAALNPLKGPGSIRGFKPHVSWAQKAGIGSKFPVIKSKFRPSDIDPNIPVYDKQAKRDMPSHQETPKVYLPKPKLTAAQREKLKAPIVRTTKIQTALWLLGIDRSAITPANLVGSGSFWEKPPEHLWNMLELAKRRYTYEMGHAHPDRGGSAMRAAQLTAAWNLTKKLFARRGFVLHK
jgi:DNA-binding CsgD family transcriptional regulator